MEEHEGGKRRVVNHRDLEVYDRAFKAAMALFEASKHFPREERYSLTDQILRSSRSVCANTAEAWRRRRYPAAFVERLSLAKAEATETQVWLEFAVACQFMPAEPARQLYSAYAGSIGTLVGMINHPDTWTIRPHTDGETKT